MVVEHFFESREALIEALTERCQQRLSDCVSQHGGAAFYVSGGSTPELVYKALSEKAMPWANIHIAMVDERWVDIDHARSNEAFLNRCLRIHAARQAPFVGMKNSATTPHDGWQVCEDHFQAIPQKQGICILGMGGDGHTASFFPHAEGLDNALQSSSLVAPLTAHHSEVTGDEVDRMTMTLSAIQQAGDIVLLITGQDKLDVYRAALASDDVAQMPVRAVLQQSTTPVHIFWAA
ncbi:MAG TPA: 6-phosphogluconolactonase [Pseudomonadales bacterium]|nr:6-phosphogluconolactonase [Pseudomonadales bacterium]